MRIFDRIDAARRRGEAFCVATVVRTADVTSAKAGAKAVVSGDGDLDGHLGGACVQRAVIAAASEALQCGAARLIRVKPSERVISLTDEDGAQVFRSGCPSGGTVDILIEPYMLPPMLVILGGSEIAKALARQAAMAGYRLAVMEDVAASVDLAEVAVTCTPEDLGPLSLTAQDFVVVASQGVQDMVCLRAALLSPARQVSMVASRRKADVLKDRLRREGLPEARLSALKAPAGLDIGAIDPSEIALSILSEIVQWRRRAEHVTHGQHEDRA